MKPTIIWAAVLSAVAMSVSCHKQTPTAVQSPQNTTQTYTMSDGLQITPLEVEPDEIGSILGIQQWRFRVVAPSDQDHIQHTIELREPGRPATRITCSTMWGMDGRDREMVVALYPIGGELHTAEKVRTYVRLGGGTSSGIRDNPLKGLGGSSRSPLAPMQEDESLLLMEFSRGGRYPDPNNPRLLLTLKLGEKVSP